MRLFIIARKHQNHYFDLKHISFSNKPTKINYLKYPEYSTNLLHMLSWIVLKSIFEEIIAAGRYHSFSKKLKFTVTIEASVTVYLRESFGDFTVTGKYF